MKDNRKRLEAAYTEHRTAVYHTALAFCKNAATAEDVMQDVFISLYNEWEQNKTVRHLRAWLLTATRHRCTNLLRDGKRECPVEDTDTVWNIPMPDETERIALRQLLGTLTDEERLPFCLHCLDGYTYREIAAGLGIPQGTVQTRVRSARQKLRRALREL